MAAGVLNYGKGGGKGAVEAEKKCRTLDFRKFPTDTNSATIIAFIDNVIQDYKNNIEDHGVYVFGKFHADGGAARFKSSDLV